jgi:glycosyltransferase involved in cell wall biosynthesis
MKYSIENPLVSILMPARDAEEFIAEAITSALHQRYSNLEVLVAVDSSSDQTEHIVRQLGRMDSRVRLIEAGSIGFPHVRDLLLEAAEGEFIAILDADDVCQPERIGTQVDFLRRHPDIDVVMMSRDVV